MDIEVHENKAGTFYGSNGKVAEVWQENLLQTALAAGVITASQDSSSGFLKLLWNHNSSATRKEVFAIMATLQTLKNVGSQTLYLNFSGEVQYKPTKTQVLSTDATLVTQLENKNFGAVVAALSPTPSQYRTE